MLGPRIAIVRRAAGISQSKLAEELGISPSAIGMYEQGRREPSVQTLARISEILGVSMDFLVRGKPGNALEEAAMNDLLLQQVVTTDIRLDRRENRPFSRQELAVLFAAMLMEP